MKTLTNLSYELGKKAHKQGITDCEPLADKVFTLYLKKYNVPIVQCVAEYTRGYYDRKTKIDTAANLRRLEFTLV